MIETERLILRTWQKKDLKHFIQINLNPKVMYYSKILTEEESLNSYQEIIGHFKWHGFGLWAVELKTIKNFIGYIGLTILPFKFWINGRPSVEIGWRLGAN